jgi:hypothetical protein
MTARRRAPAFALAALVAAFSSAGWAAERPCQTASPTVEADPAFTARFPELLERISTDLSSRPDLDTCAHVFLRVTSSAAIQISVMLPDGRRTTRDGVQPDDLLPTLQALLLVPRPSAAPEPTEHRPVPHPIPRLRPLGPVGPTPRERDRAPATAGARTFGIELSLLGGPRMGEGQLAVGLGAHSLLEAHGFLFGFTSRVDRYQTPLSDPEMALELGLLGGKRLHFASFALDLVLGPTVAMKGFALSETVAVQMGPDRPVQPPPIGEDPSTGPVPRVLLGAHAGFTPRSVVRSFVGLQGSIGPGRGDDSPNAGSAHFPIFALGLVLGGTVGTP